MSIIERFTLLYQDISRLNCNDLGNIYSEDVEFIDPVTRHQGLASVQRYFSRLLDDTHTCTFTIHDVIACQNNASALDYIVNWTMYLTLKENSKQIVVDGTSQLKIANDKICYHRDFYDLGQMVYEHVPILRNVVSYVKGRLQ